MPRTGSSFIVVSLGLASMAAPAHSQPASQCVKITSISEIGSRHYVNRCNWPVNYEFCTARSFTGIQPEPSCYWGTAKPNESVGRATRERVRVRVCLPPARPYSASGADFNCL